LRLRFYRRFIRALTGQVRQLRRVAYDGTRTAAPSGDGALAAAALSMPDQSRFVKQVARRLTAN
jgi:uncharacterized heparinase superfamily protein